MVLQPGYKTGDTVIRPARVAVADPRDRHHRPHHHIHSSDNSGTPEEGSRPWPVRTGSEKDFYKILGVPGRRRTRPRSRRPTAKARPAVPHLTRTPVTPWRAEVQGDRRGPFGFSDPTQREEYDAIRQMAGGARFTAGGPGSARNGGFEDIFSAFGGGGGGQRVRFSTGGDRVSRGMPVAAASPTSTTSSARCSGGGAGGRAGARSTYRGDDYGDFGGFGGPTRGPRKGQDLEARTTLSFRDAVTGRRSPCRPPRAHHHHSHPRRCPRWAANSLAWQRYAKVTQERGW